jgi:hydrogenase maturation protease
MKKVLIGGIGNVLLGDDAVGPYIVRLLNADYDFADGVEIIDLGTPALDLIDHFSGKDAVILIDCVRTADVKPGKVQLFRKEELLQYQPEVRMDPHSPALVENLLSAELFGTSPRELLLIGIAGESFGPGCRLSAPVNAALPLVFREILRELDRIGVRYSPRERRTDPQIWWTSADLAQDGERNNANPNILPAY